MAIKCVFFDFDGVLRHWDFGMYGIEEKFGIPLEAIHEECFSDASVNPAVLGEITDPEWRAGVAARLVKRFPDKDAKGAVKYWDSTTGEIVPEVLALVNECKAVAKVALFTNATTKLNQDMKALGIDNLFDYVVNASEIGAKKPEPEIYHHAVKLAGVDPEEAFFVDDREHMIATAVQLGWSGHVFENAAGLRTALVDAGVL
ncbi:MAG: HAD-IA family hydrolase [Chloroflexi bacterium]|jgi:HAD superfamily hydrolase (TIGR01509 family)|nr:HAD-IA family hydrolase [Chloroflexota bacterium]